MKVTVDLQPLELLQEPLLDLRVGHVLESLDHDGKRLLVLQLMVHLGVVPSVLTDTDGRWAGLGTWTSSVAAWLCVLAMHLRLLVRTRSPVGLRVIIVDVDVVIVYYLNDFAGRAFAKAGKGVELLAASVFCCVAHEHVLMALTSGSVLGACSHLWLLMMLPGAALAL